MSAGSASGSSPSSSHGDRHEPRAREAEGLQRGEVGRVLDEHDVARVQQHRGDAAPSACCEPVVTSSSSASHASPREQKRSASSARSAGSPSVEEYCSARAATVGASVRANASAMSSAGNSSGAGRPPAKEITSARWVSSRMSRTGEERTSPRREESGGGGVGITRHHGGCRAAREESLRPANISTLLPSGPRAAPLPVRFLF